MLLDHVSLNDLFLGYGKLRNLEKLDIHPGKRIFYQTKDKLEVPKAIVISTTKVIILGMLLPR